MLMRRRLLLAAALVLAAPSLALAAGERKKGGGASFIQLPTLTATIMRENGQRGVMTVEVGLNVPETALFARADQSIPRLRAAFTQVLQVYASGLPPAGVPNADYLARELQRQTDTVLGRPGAQLMLGTILVN